MSLSQLQIFIVTIIAAFSLKLGTVKAIHLLKLFDLSEKTLIIVKYKKKSVYSNHGYTCPWLILIDSERT